MSWSFPIGRVFGIELRVHATFFLLLAWIGIAGYSTGGPAGAALYTLYIVLLFLCVIAHEFGHALMARRFGIRTPDVTLLPIGGLARLEKMPERPAQEILVALAGPAVNVVIFAVLALVFRFDPSTVTLGEITFADLPAQIAVLNLILALFNLIPAFPMDGGRVLRALLASVTDRARATRMAATAGQILAFAMGLTGLVIGNPMLLLIAFFVFMSAGAESSGEAMRALASRYRARDAMITNFESLAPDDSLSLAANTLIRTTQHEFPVLDRATGRPLGLLTRTALYGALNQDNRPRDVSAAMTRDLPSARLTDGLDSVLALLDGPAGAVAVIGPDGAMVGYVTRENLGELMVVAGTRHA